MEQFLLAPPHSLLRQSWAAVEMREATVNADGFGFCWQGEANQMLTYKSSLPVWSDNNLAALGRCLKSDTWLANVRSATPGQAPGEINTQPFIGDDLVWLHNGYIKPFSTAIKQALLGNLDNRLRAEINGNTDSEYLFAVIKHFYAREKQLAESIRQAMALLKSVGEPIEAMLNIILYADQRLYLCRHAINADCPSLYYTRDNAAYPGGAWVVSERLDESASWQAVNEHAIMEITPTEERMLFTL